MNTTEDWVTSTSATVSRYQFKAPLLNTTTAGITICVGLFGLFGNTISAIVLTKMEKSFKNMKLLKFLTFVDMFLIVLAYIDFAMGMERPEVNMVDKVRNVLLPICHPLALTLYTVEIYQTVLIAVQRCVAVTCPLYRGFITDDTFAWKAFATVIAFGVVFNIPHWLAYPPEIYWDSGLNMTWMRNDVSEIGRSQGFVEVYSGYVTLVVRTIIPMVVLAVANVLIVICVRRTSVRRMQLTTQQRDDKVGRTTAVILAITAMSFFTHFISASVRILMTRWMYDTNMWKEAYVRFSIVLITINSSTNFIFYCSFGTEFRKVMTSLCNK